jgi:anthraniloyl-CoA monooxygenase
VIDSNGGETAIEVAWVQAPGEPESVETAVEALAGAPAVDLVAIAAADGSAEAEIARTLLAERARLALGLRVALVGPDIDVDGAVTLLLTGRADVVAVGAAAVEELAAAAVGAAK